jgi:hypothetical protein
MKIGDLFEGLADIESDILEAIAKVRKEKNITAFAFNPAGAFVADELSDMGYPDVARQYKSWYINSANKGFKGVECPWGDAVCETSMSLYKYARNMTKNVKMDQGDLGS